MTQELQEKLTERLKEHKGSPSEELLEVINNFYKENNLGDYLADKENDNETTNAEQKEIAIDEEECMCTVNIKGREWNFHIMSREELPDFYNCEGETFVEQKEIAICGEALINHYKAGAHEEIQNCIRHEVIHAYLYECGLFASTIPFEKGWALNEEMVDWFASQMPLIEKTTQDCYSYITENLNND